jgi:hypothetical protein
MESSLSIKARRFVTSPFCDISAWGSCARFISLNRPSIFGLLPPGISFGFLYIYTVLFILAFNSPAGSISITDAISSNGTLDLTSSPEVVISATALQQLIRDPGFQESIGDGGFTLRGARIKGHLDLQFASITIPLIFENCHITGPIFLSFARVQGIYLQSTTLWGIEGSGLQIEENLMLREGSSVGWLRLPGASVEGTLDLTGSTLGFFAGDGIFVGSRASFSQSTVLGPVRLLEANVAGQLDFSDCTIVSSSPEAIIAERIHVGGAVLLDRCNVTGTSDFSEASIDGNFSAQSSRLTSNSEFSLSLRSATLQRGLFLTDNISTTGGLDLTFARVEGPAGIQGHVISNGGPAIAADSFRVGGGLFLSDGLIASGETRLLGANIDGILNLSASHFINPNGFAINAEGCRVNGNLIGNRGCDVSGEILLRGADVEGMVQFLNAQMHSTGNAITAQEIEVGQSLEVSVCQVAGPIDIAGATVCGSLLMVDTHLTGGPDWALRCDGARVRRDVILREGTTIIGGFRLRNTIIEGGLSATGLTIHNPGDQALNGGGLDVAGDVQLTNATFTGDVILSVMSVGGQMTLRGARLLQFSYLNLDGAEIDDCLFLDDGFVCHGSVNLSGSIVHRALVMRRWGHSPVVSVDLRHAHLGILDQDRSAWPVEGQLFLQGLKYDLISGEADVDREMEWLGLQPGTPDAADAYSVLARYYASLDYRDEAKRVLVMRASLFWGCLRKALTWVVGYGYHPWQGVLIFSIFLLPLTITLLFISKRYGWLKFNGRAGKKDAIELLIIWSLWQALNWLVPVLNLRLVPEWNWKRNNRPARIVESLYFMLRILGLLWAGLIVYAFGTLLLGL